MIDFKQFMNLTAQRKCPEGFRFDEKLKVCVPKGQGRYYGAFGFGIAKPDNTASEIENGETENGETENGNMDVANGMNGGTNGAKQ